MVVPKIILNITKPKTLEPSRLLSLKAHIFKGTRQIGKGMEHLNKGISLYIKKVLTWFSGGLILLKFGLILENIEYKFIKA